MNYEFKVFLNNFLKCELLSLSKKQKDLKNQLKFFTGNNKVIEAHLQGAIQINKTYITKMYSAIERINDKQPNHNIKRKNIAFVPSFKIKTPGLRILFYDYNKELFLGELIELDLSYDKILITVAKDDRSSCNSYINIEEVLTIGEKADQEYFLFFDEIEKSEIRQNYILKREQLTKEQNKSDNQINQINQDRKKKIKEINDEFDKKITEYKLKHNCFDLELEASQMLLMLQQETKDKMINFIYKKTSL